jgi:uncharacterized protein YqkB
MNDILVEGIILPDKPLSNFELLDAVNKLKIKNFRGIFMRDELSQKPNKKECGILNLDDTGNNPPGNNGTHWVCWFCADKINYYFDSFGLSPPLEIQQYLRGQIEINISQVQPQIHKNVMLPDQLYLLKVNRNSILILKSSLKMYSVKIYLLRYCCNS